MSHQGHTFCRFSLLKPHTQSRLVITRGFLHRSPCSHSVDALTSGPPDAVPVQSSLTWLDLSFNKIAKIEGLDKLTKLVDLSLFNNQIAKIENLDQLKELNVLSLGKLRSHQLWVPLRPGQALCK